MLVYVIYSKLFDQIYIGQTKNIESGLERHNIGLVKSTKPYLPWIVIHTEKYSIRAEAMKREKELKSHQGRNFIRENFIPV